MVNINIPAQREKALKAVSDLYTSKAEHLERIVRVQLEQGMGAIVQKKVLMTDYVDHIASIYAQIVEENNPLTMGVLNLCPDSTYKIIHNGIETLRGCFGNDPRLARQPNELSTADSFRIKNLEKIVNLRANTRQELFSLLEEGDMYLPVVLGFAEVSPKSLVDARKKINEAQAYLNGYENFHWLGKFLDRKKHQQEKAKVDSEECVYLDYVLTTLGMNAVTRVSGKIVDLAEAERIFEND